MKSKTLATWLAFLLGSLGVHRLYLHGLSDRLAWLYLPPTLLGAYGVQRMLALGQDDHAAWVLIPLLGVTLSLGALAAIRYGLTPDERWNARFNPGGPADRSGWGAVIGVIVALMVGATVLMATIAFSTQRFFEAQVEAGRGMAR
jgi:hypothetical protein